MYAVESEELRKKQRQTDAAAKQGRWRVQGLGLSAHVLAKVYYENALSLLPALERDAAARRVAGN